MHIRNEQMDAFSEEQENGFRKRLTEMLKKEYPEDCDSLDEDEFDTVLDQGIARARSYSIEREKDIGLYFHVMFNLAYNFDSNSDYPWAAEILKRDDLTGEEKVSRVAKLAQAELDRQAAEHSE